MLAVSKKIKVETRHYDTSPLRFKMDFLKEAFLMGWEETVTTYPTTLEGFTRALIV